MRELINKIVIEGRLGKDAELVEFNNGTRTMVRFDIAHPGDSTTWIPIRTFEQGAESASKLLKGQLVKVTGCLRQRKLVVNDKKIDYLYVRASTIRRILK